MVAGDPSQSAWHRQPANSPQPARRPIISVALVPFVQAAAAQLLTGFVQIEQRFIKQPVPLRHRGDPRIRKLAW
jgi:hypothetical protein